MFAAGEEKKGCTLDEWMDGWMRKDAHRDFDSSHKGKKRENYEGKCDLLDCVFSVIINNKIIISQTPINNINNK